jgi:hypothetical protein
MSPPVAYDAGPPCNSLQYVILGLLIPYHLLTCVRDTKSFTCFNSTRFSSVIVLLSLVSIFFGVVFISLFLRAVQYKNVVAT